MKPRSVAVLLAVLLGGLGIHKFYTNRPGWGILYLVFCWTFVPLVLGLVEGIYWATMSDDQFEAEVMADPAPSPVGGWNGEQAGEARSGVNVWALILLVVLVGAGFAYLR